MNVPVNLSNIEEKPLSYMRKPIPHGYRHFKHWLDECGYYLFSTSWINIEAQHGCYSLAQKAKIKTASSFLLERITAEKFKNDVIVYMTDTYETLPLSKLSDTYWDQVSEINGNGPYIGNINTISINGTVYLSSKEDGSLFDILNAHNSTQSEKYFLIEKPARNNLFLDAIAGLITHFGWRKILDENELNTLFENYLESHYSKLSERQTKAILTGVRQGINTS